ncbi:MAG: hypothetical protein R6U04_05795 [Bacteroidales bacterium]
MVSIRNANKIIFWILVILSVSIHAANAQQTLYGDDNKKEDEVSGINISDSELETFIEVYDQMSELEGQYNLKILDIIEKHGMEPDRYETISVAQRMNQDIDVDEKEMSTYRNIKNEIDREKRKTKQQMEKILLNHQIEQDRYNAVMKKLSEDSLFRVKFDSIHRENYNP